MNAIDEFAKSVGMLFSIKNSKVIIKIPTINSLGLISEGYEVKMMLSKRHKKTLLTCYIEADGITENLPQRVRYRKKGSYQNILTTKLNIK